MPFSEAHTRHSRLDICFFFGGSASSSEDESAFRTRFFGYFLEDMLALVDVEEESKVSKSEDYKYVGGVVVRSGQASVKAMWLQGLTGEASGSWSTGESMFMYCYAHLPWGYEFQRRLGLQEKYIVDRETINTHRVEFRSSLLVGLDVQTSVDTMPDAKHNLSIRSGCVVPTIELSRKTTLYSGSAFTPRLYHMRSLSRIINMTSKTIARRNLFTNVDYESGMAAQLRWSPARKQGQGFCPAHD
jgi:hypothetical protein